jgi:glycosyltransferase involved in cell wall biosynthesis
MRLVIIDPHWTGHHPVYVKRIADGASSRNIRCLIVTSVPPNQVPEYAAMESKKDPLIEWVVEKINLPDSTSDQLAPLASRQYIFWRYLRTISKRMVEPNADIVLLPYFDDYSFAIGLLGSPFGSTRWAGISMRSTFHHPNLGILGTTRTLLLWAKELLYNRIFDNPTLTKIFFIDETVLLKNARNFFNIAKVSFLPDPSTPARPLVMAEVRAQFGFSRDDFVILMYGAISKRKGLKSLLAILANKKLAGPVKALVVGSFDHDCRTELANWLDDDIERRAKITFIDDYVSGDVEAQCLTACDIVWLAYQNHLTMSGVLVQAGNYKKPIVGHDSGLIGWYINKHALGIIIPADDHSEAADTISKLSRNSSALDLLGTNNNNTFSNFTVEAFQNTLLNNLLGTP